MSEIVETKWTFEVYDKRDEKWFQVGSTEDLRRSAETNKISFEYSRDKRTKKPKYRICRYETVRIVEQEEA